MTKSFAAMRLIFLTLRSLVLLPIALAYYAVTRRTSEFGHQALIWLFCVTGGRSNDFLSKVIASFKGKIEILKPAGVLGELSADLMSSQVQRLRQDGYAVFERALGSDACHRLLEFAFSTESRVRRMDGESRSVESHPVLYEGRNPIAVRYDYAPGALLDNPDVQALLADQSLIALAQEYLGCVPIADVLNMWWHTNYHTQPDSEAAQFYHFDMDRIKWLKIFVYLTDVGCSNGPHSFVRGSHRSGVIPSKLLLRGYERLSDSDVSGAFAESDQLQFSAPRGSIIVEDTRGLHKGASVVGESRLVLQLQFSNCLFGATYPQARMSKVKDPLLESMLIQAPGIYAQYV